MTFLTPPAQRARLRSFEPLLNGDGFPTRLVPAGGESPYDVLLVRLGDAGTEGPVLELAFLPGMEAELERASLLQCFVPLPPAVAPGAEGELARLVLALGTRLPLIGFGYLETERIPCFRHLLMLPEAPEAGNLLLRQTVWLVSYLLDLFGGAVAAVAAGRKRCEEALAEHPMRDALR
ncbi:MAG TPA: hypothetical protein VHG28_24265 [Longimicrobiaceae bacterium]|nr:hypothetical protein [Longimicrobiaceae bacterium]